MNLSQTGRALLLSGGFLALFSFVSPDTPTRPTSTEGAHHVAKRKLMADKKASTITYAMRHPMHTWEGVCRDVNGAIVYDDESKKVETVAIVAKVASFDSQNANRDSHAIEVLEGIKYPNVTFASQQVQDDGSGKLTVTGRLTFHGVTRAVTVPVVRKESGGVTVYEGSFVTKLTDHQIEKPSLMMVPVEDELKIKFSLAFRM
ncbi:YceI family protein [Rudanella lutea]|uniref:YceI family protein n=1 Tax=Rudanella lutea TaxID=451374 RepID=UPI00036AE846|nr:YceI family protein [Rudanella lutea]